MTTVVSRLMRLISRSLGRTSKSATAPSSMRVPSASMIGIRARSSTDWRSDSRNASRIVSSRSSVRSSGSLSPRIAPVTVSATSSVLSPSCAARLRSTMTCTSSSPLPASERTASSPGTDDSRRTTSFETSASRSVDSPVSCRLKLEVPAPPWSNEKLGSPMMISGMSAMIISITSPAGTFASSFGFRYSRVPAWSVIQ